MYQYKCACGETFTELRRMDERRDPIDCPKKADGEFMAGEHVTEFVPFGCDYIRVNDTKVGPGEEPGTEAVYKRTRVIGNDSVGRMRVDKMMRNHRMIGNYRGEF